MKAMLGDDRPTPPPTHCARVADAPTPQPARDSPPWHPGILPNETSMLTIHHATPATRDDVPARMSGTGQAESPLGSCPASLERPSMSSNTSTSLLECGRFTAGCAFQAAAWKLNVAPPSRRWRHRAAPTRHQRATCISTSLHTRQRSERTNDIANAPFWRLAWSILKLFSVQSY